MLTSDDLKKIRNVLGGEVKAQLSAEIQPLRQDIKEDTKSIVREEVKPIKDDIGQIRKNFATKKNLESIKDDVAEIRKDVKTVVSFFDREYLDLRKRVEKIEEHLKIQPSN
jgi:hypothetical protein